MNRRRRYWLIGWLPLLLFVLIGGIPFIWQTVDREAQYRRSADSLTAAIRETDAIDPNWRWEDLDATRPDVPDEENIVRQIGVIHPLCGKRMGFRRNLILGGGPPINMLILEEVVATNQLYSPEEVAMLEEHQVDFEPALILARNLHQFEKARYRLSLARNPLTTLNRYPQDVREVLTLLGYECTRLEMKNRPSEVIRLLHGMINTTQSLKDELLLIPHLVRYAGRAIVAGEIERLLGRTEPGLALQELIEPLEKMTQTNDLIWGIRGERGSSHRMFEFYEQDDTELLRSLDDMRGFGPKSSKPFNAHEYRPYLKQDHATTLRLLNRLVETFELPLYEQVNATNRIALPRDDENMVLTHMFFPALVKVIEADRRTTAQIDCSRIAIAAELFRHENQRWPKDLQEIPKTWLKEIPIDPYDGKPMRYLIEAEGVVIYSVGLDQIDQQGKLEIRSAQGEPGDLGIRLWNPNKRRLPPPPELLPDPDELSEVPSPEEKN